MNFISANQALRNTKTLAQANITTGYFYEKAVIAIERSLEKGLYSASVSVDFPNFEYAKALKTVLTNLGYRVTVDYQLGWLDSSCISPAKAVVTMDWSKAGDM